jgi:hypothetical protein
MASVCNDELGSDSLHIAALYTVLEFSHCTTKRPNLWRSGVLWATPRNFSGLLLYPTPEGFPKFFGFRLRRRTICMVMVAYPLE